MLWSSVCLHCWCLFAINVWMNNKLLVSFSSLRPLKGRAIPAPVPPRRGAAAAASVGRRGVEAVATATAALVRPGRRGRWTTPVTRSDARLFSLTRQCLSRLTNTTRSNQSTFEFYWGSHFYKKGKGYYSRSMSSVIGKIS